MNQVNHRRYECKEIIIKYNLFESINDLATLDRELLERAIVATESSYSPYSNFKVGAAARLDSNKVITGSNQENASYGATICAERTLIALHAQNHIADRMNTIAISYNHGKPSKKPLSPCGICRQSLIEHEIRQGQGMIRFILGSHTGQVIEIFGAKSLLPLAFNKDALGL